MTPVKLIHACTLGWMLLVLGFPAPISAKSSRTFGYDYDKIWQTTVRLLRVDYRCPLKELDKDAGFLLFEFAEAGKRHPGSIEFVRTEEGVTVQIQLSTLPGYFENMIESRLSRKLLSEYGEPAVRRSRPSEQAPAQQAPETPPGEAPQAPTHD